MAEKPGRDAVLVKQFVDTFRILDDTVFFADLEPEAVPLAVPGVDELGYQHWEPRAVRTSRGALSQLYEKLPARFPPLYEDLVLGYRWAKVDLEFVTLFANPMGAGLAALKQLIFRDAALVEVLLPNGLLQFGKAGGGDYDPVCFDTRRRRHGGDSPVVRVDHEEILCDHRLSVSEELAPSFRVLVEKIIAKAAEVHGRAKAT